MADFKQFEINGVPFNSKDDVARSAISGDGGLIDIIGLLESSKQDTLVSGTNIKTIDSISLLGSGNVEILPYAGNAITGNIDGVVTPGLYKTNGTLGSRGLLVVNSTTSGRTTTITQTRIVNGNVQYRTGELLNDTVSTWSTWADIIDLSPYAPLASPALTGTPTAPTAASGTNTTQIATTAFVQNALSNMGAGGSEMVDVTITGTTSSASFSTNPYNAIKAVVDDGKIAVLNASVDPLSTTGVLIPVYEYTYSQSGSDFTGYKGKIQNGNYEISVDVQSTSSATVTITSVGSSITVDTALSESSTNPVQNRVITAQILENEEIVATALNNLNDRVELKQDQLVSGTTIKTINNQSILGSGNITISGGGGGGGEENVIESITFNGNTVPVDANKNAAITASIPDDSTLVHKGTSSSSQAETIYGIKTFENELHAYGGIDVYQGEITSTAAQDFSYITDSSSNDLQTALDAKFEGVELILNCELQGGSSGYKLYKNGSEYNPYSDLVSIVASNKLPVIAVNHNQGFYGGYIPMYEATTGYFSGSGIDKGFTGNAMLAEISCTSSSCTVYVQQAASIEAVNAKYSKPSGGIPSTDLTSAVQTSLGKADTALQSYTETDPVFTASAAHGISSTDISNWNAKGTYSKPSGGIPATDLATAVSQRLLPEGNGSTDDGKIVQYSYLGGGWQMVKPITIYTGSTAPSSSTGSNGDIYIQTS